MTDISQDMARQGIPPGKPGVRIHDEPRDHEANGAPRCNAAGVASLSQRGALLLGPDAVLEGGAAG